MRTDFVVREVVTGLRRNVTMTIAMVLTTAISLVMVGTGLLAVRTIDRTEQLYSDGSRCRSRSPRTSPQPTRTAASRSARRLMVDPGEHLLVASVRFESQQQAYERYLELFEGQSLAEVVRPSRRSRCG